MSDIIKNKKEFGKSLVEAAQKNYEDNARKLLIDRTSDLISMQPLIEERIAELETGLRMITATLDAISSGDFVVEAYGKIRFNNPKLQQFDVHNQSTWIGV